MAEMSFKLSFRKLLLSITLNSFVLIFKIIFLHSSIPRSYDEINAQAGHTSSTVAHYYKPPNPDPFAACQNIFLRLF
jgi:hypothetical protein